MTYSGKPHLDQNLIWSYFIKDNWRQCEFIFGLPNHEGLGPQWEIKIPGRLGLNGFSDGHHSTSDC